MKKFTKKALSLAVASFVTVSSSFGGNVISADAATKNVVSAMAATQNYKVTYTPATEKPTAAPTVTPVDGPQVKVSVENATSYYEEDGDTLSVVMDLIEGATSATYSIDNGPKTTVTGKTVIKLGEGKIAGTDIKLEVTSTDGTTENTQTFTYTKKSKAAEKATTSKTAAASMVSSFGVVKSAAVSQAKTLPVHFKLPASDWETNGYHVFCYAYYTNEYGKVEKPLDAWPGRQMTKSSDGYYNVDITTTTGDVKVMFASVKGDDNNKGGYHGVGSKLYDANGNYIGQSFEEYFDAEVKYQLPYGLSTNTDNKGNTIPIEGLSINKEVWIAFDEAASSKDYATIKITDSKEVKTNPTVAPATPTVDPSATPTVDPNATATPAPELDAYFGASLSAPQLNTTAQTLSAVTVNASGKVTYSFSVDGEEVYSGNQNNIAWDTTSLEAGTHEISATVKDKSGKTVTKKKNYTIVVSAPAVTATPEVTEAPATATPEVTEAPTATPVVTVAPTATPVVTKAPTATPVVTVAPTATPVVTVTPAATTAVTIDNSGVPNAPVVTATNTAITSVTEGAILISFNKAGKTAGETIKVSADASSVKDAAKLTYTVTKNNSAIKTLASKTTKSSVNWTPTTSGTYTVEVTAFNAKGDAVANGSSTYVVKKRVINIKSITPAKLRASKKSAMKIKATCTKGTLRLKVVIKNSKNKTVKTVKYSKKKTFKWKPSKKGNYKVTITGKNSKGVVVTVTKKVRVLKKAKKK